MDQQRPPAPALYGVMAEFADPTALVAAARQTYDAGYREFDSYSPFPIHELFDAMHCKDRRVPIIVLVGGIIGCAAGFGMQAWISAFDYPLNIGGKPFNSWPAWIPITFETTVLFAAFGAVFGMLALNGLPMPYHPVFNVSRFEQASRDRFFLVIQARDPQFELAKVRDFLDSLNPREVTDVPW